MQIERSLIILNGCNKKFKLSNVKKIYLYNRSFPGPQLNQLDLSCHIINVDVVQT